MPSEPRRCVVVGGGLLGGHTAAALARSGRQVTVFSRSFSGWLRANRTEGIELVEGVVPPEDEIAPLLVDADAVCCFVGYSTPARSGGSALASVNEWLMPSLSVLECAARCGVGRVILASSGGTIYGPAAELPTPEAHPPAPISAHGATSAAIETFASLFSRTGELEALVLRFPNVYGPGERVRGEQGVIAAWCESLALGEPLRLIGDPGQSRDFLYAGDAADAAVTALDRDLSGVYNVGSGESARLDHVLELLGEVAEREPVVEQREGRAVDVFASGLDSSEFSRRTGWEPKVTLREGIAETWRWTTSAPMVLRFGGGA